MYTVEEPQYMERQAEMTAKQGRKLLEICKRLLEQSIQDQENEFSRSRKFMLSEDCKFTLYREADLLIKELEENN